MDNTLTSWHCNKMHGIHVTKDDHGDIHFHNEQGEHHRLDGPAAIWADGTRFWFRNGKLHRNDGPAIEWPSGGMEWWQEGELLTEVEFNVCQSLRSAG